MRIDFHRHLLKRENEVEGLFLFMEKFHIDKTVLLPLPSSLEFLGYSLGDNKEILKVVKAYPDKFIGAIYIDPREKNTVDRIKFYLDEGFRLIKLFPPVGYFPDSTEFFPVFEFIAKERIPVISHTGYTNITIRGYRKATHSRYSEIINFDVLVRMFPEIPFIFAHCGDPDFNLALLMCDANENVYLNPVGGEEGWDARIIKFWEEGGKVFPFRFDKLLWGSDNLPLEGGLKEWENFFIRNGAGEYLPQFFGGLAERILSL